MLMIRLQRAGKKNRPEFRIVLAEKESSAVKKITEILGYYNPRTKDFSIKQDRFQYWMSQHVALSPTVHNLFVNQKLVDAPKVKSFSIPAKPVEPETPAAAKASSAETPAAGEGTPAVTEPAETTTEPVAEAPAEATLPVSAEPDARTEPDEAVIVKAESAEVENTETSAE